MANPSASRSFEKMTRLLLGATIFILPLFFLPITPEAAELPKQYALAVLVLLSVLSWIGHAVVSRTFEFRRTAFDIPLVIFWVILLLATLTSQDRLSSLIGNYDNNTWSFLSLSLLAILFFLITQIVRNRADADWLIGVLVASGIAAEAYFILKSLTPALVRWIPLGLTSSVSVLASVFGVFALLVLLVSLAGLVGKRERIRNREILWGIGAALSLITLVLIGFKTLWMLVAVGLALFLIYAVARIEEHRFYLVIAGFVLFVASILFSFFGVPQFLSVRLPLEVGLSQGVSWDVVSSAVTSGVKKFLIGGGPATFSMDFSRYRPESFNANFAWNVRFGQPSSTVLELLGSTGVLGMVAFAAVVLLGIGTILITWFRKVTAGGFINRVAKDESAAEFMPLFWAVATAWVTLLVAGFFMVYTSVLWFLFFVLLALLSALSMAVLREHESSVRFSLKTSPQYTLLVSFGFIIASAAILVFGIFLSRFLVAEVYYARGLSQVVRGAPEEAIANFSRAIAYHPRRASYHVSLAQGYLLQGLKLVGAGQADPNLITTLVALAVNEAKRATELAPSNVAAWQSLATMYANARPIAPDANTWVLRSLERAIELEGTNPILYVQMGNAQFVARNNDEAIKNYQRAIQLKPDYIDAYINLATLEEGTGKVDDAINHLSQALLLAPQNADILFNLGRMYYNRNKEGDLVRARAAFELTVQANASHANALFSLGLLHERIGEPGKALEYYRRVLKLNPDNAEVKRKIQALAPAPVPAQP